jgi:hypothetical protein
MAANKNKREVKFTLKDDDYRAFGRYRIMYTEQGHRLVRRQRMTYLITAAMIAGLFTLFKVDHTFTMLMYVIAAAMAVAGIFFAESFVLRQQDRAIQADAGSADRVHAGENTIRFDDDSFTTYGNGDEQTFKYSDIKLIDLTEEAIYVWMSDTMIMPVPLHAFRSMENMKELYKWIKDKIEEQGGTVREN